MKVSRRNDSQVQDGKEGSPDQAGVSGAARKITNWENRMNNTLLKLYVKFQGLKNEDGQDLVEYALLVALIALVCVTGVSNVASAINTVFSNISSSLA
jgi:pilus assembly protein Flp/PilA